MDNNCKGAVAELEKFINEREEMVQLIENSIDKYIIDRTLPFDYKEKYVQWQQDLLDLIELQLKNAKDYKDNIL